MRSDAEGLDLGQHAVQRRPVQLAGEYGVRASTLRGHRGERGQNRSAEVPVDPDRVQSGVVGAGPDSVHGAGVTGCAEGSDDRVGKGLAAAVGMDHEGLNPKISSARQRSSAYETASQENSEPSGADLPPLRAAGSWQLRGKTRTHLPDRAGLQDHPKSPWNVRVPRRRDPQ